MSPSDTPDSTVHGILSRDGLFDGHISTPQEQYYVEPSHRYFPGGEGDGDDRRRRDFHSVIYKASDVLHPRPPSSDGDCASHGLHLRRREEEMRLDPGSWAGLGGGRQPDRKSFTEETVITGKRRVRRQAAEGQLFENLPQSPPAAAPSSSSSDQYGEEVVAKEYWPFAQGQKTVTTYEIVDWADVPESVRHHFRKRANLRNGVSGVDAKKKTCMLYLQADHLFYRQMGSEEAAIDVMTRHVQRVNSIYKDIGEGISDLFPILFDKKRNPGSRFISGLFTEIGIPSTFFHLPTFPQTLTRTASPTTSPSWSSASRCTPPRPWTTAATASPATTASRSSWRSSPVRDLTTNGIWSL